MMFRMLGNWQTTLLGQAAAVLNLMANGMNWKTALMSGVFSLMGLVAKDASTGSQPGATL